MTKKSKLVVIGNGMAGARVVEEILKRDPNKFEIVMFGAEPYGNYNRILLSNVLNQTQTPQETFLNPLTWYQENDIVLHAGVKAVMIDVASNRVIGSRVPPNVNAYDAYDTSLVKDAVTENYDRVIIATGSRPFVPPIEGSSLPGVFLFRTIDDCHRIAGFAKNCRKAIVIGGGLLGLEAARGLLTHNLEVTVVEAAAQLMPVQLDVESGQMLKRTIEGMGISVIVNGRTKRIVAPQGKITALEFQDGTAIETDMVIISAGIRPITEIAQASGITVNKGIVCNDKMQTNIPEIFALGECVEHRGRIYGLVDPIWEQANVLADILTETNPEAKYEGSKVGTKLKVMGVELASMGEKETQEPNDEVLVYRDLNRGVYKKMLVRNNKILGSILLGEITVADSLMRVFFMEKELPKNRAEVLFGELSGATTFIKADDLPENAQICNCNGISKKKIIECIQKDQCHSVSAIGAKTKAGKGCGSCRGLIAQIIESTVGKVSYDPAEHYYVPGVPLEKSQLIREIRNQGIKSVSGIFEKLAAGKEDADSKIGLASLLKIIWPKEYEDERDARFINDRVHANIQKDGTFSVVPRIYGGVTTADELLRIAQAAVKYKVKMIKLTGGQRIDLLGLNKADLPKIWKDIGMPSGHAYTKAFRTCKSCVGTDFCRYGLGDSISLAQKIEMRFQGVESPHKVKMATTGCPRNCAEAYVKDVGVVAIEGGLWEIYIGGAAGSIIRKGDLLCTIGTDEEVLKHISRFLQYYREHAKYLERTYGFVERIGIDVLKNILIKDSLGICQQLEDRMQETVEAFKDPWKEADIPAYDHQFDGPRMVEVVSEANNNG